MTVKYKFAIMYIASEDSYPIYQYIKKHDCIENATHIYLISLQKQLKNFSYFSTRSSRL